MGRVKNLSSPPLLSGLQHHMKVKHLKDAVVAVLAGRSQRRLGDGLSEALGLMGFKSHNQISKTLTIAEFAEHQCKKLVPAGEMFDILVTNILVNKVAELVIV